MTSIEIVIITTVGTVLASSGFWALLLKIWDRRSGSTRLLMGLAMDRILFIARQHLKKGYITYEDYQDLHNYLYGPYSDLGGDGTVKRIMEKIEQLPIHYERHDIEVMLEGTMYEKPDL